jgi:hypothetical protein
MDYCILRKVAFKFPNSKRVVWAVIVAEREGLSLLFVRTPDTKRPHQLVIALENPSERIFETAKNVSHFPLGGSEDLEALGNKLRALAENLSNEDFHSRFFGPDDDWWKE